MALNSNLDTGRSSEPLRWLRKVLADNPSRCTVAYLHHPLVSSGAHGSNADLYDDVNVRPIWEALYRAGVELVLVGHDHH
ncbi:MAG: metallophosphoesterase [Longimicrobiales bacterium]